MDHTNPYKIYYLGVSPTLTDLGHLCWKYRTTHKHMGLEIYQYVVRILLLYDFVYLFVMKFCLLRVYKASFLIAVTLTAISAADRILKLL